LHDGSYSANPPYTLIEVIGTPITSRIKNEFGQFVFNDFRETPNGFEHEDLCRQIDRFETTSATPFAFKVRICSDWSSYSSVTIRCEPRQLGA
jgi:hypothetical protein